MIENDSSDEPHASTSPHSWGAHWILLTVSEREWVWVCLCVSVCKERESVWVCKRLWVCVWVCVRRESVWVCVRVCEFVCERVSEWESVWKTKHERLLEDLWSKSLTHLMTCAHRTRITYPMYHYSPSRLSPAAQTNVLTWMQPRQLATA